MITAALYGLLASSGLLVGALIGMLTTPPRQLVAAVTAFGSGVLVSALSFDLMGEAFALGSPTPTPRADCAFSPRMNQSKTVGSSAGEMPMPWSTTRTSA